MKLDVYEASIPVVLGALANLDALLDKLAAHAQTSGVDEKVYLAARLYPDMFDCTKQIQVACDFAKNLAARLSAQEPPKFADTETTIAELKARVAKTVAFVGGVPRAAFDGAEDRTVVFPMGKETMSITGLAYLTRFGLPNFYFHFTAAYAILRHCGVPLVKRDFIGAL